MRISQCMEPTTRDTCFAVDLAHFWLSFRTFRTQVGRKVNTLKMPRYHPMISRRHDSRKNTLQGSQNRHILPPHHGEARGAEGLLVPWLKMSTRTRYPCCCRELAHLAGKSAGHGALLATALSPERADSPPHFER